jgi:hypothetical protein
MELSVGPYMALSEKELTVGRYMALSEKELTVGLYMALSEKELIHLSSQQLPMQQINS